MVFSPPKPGDNMARSFALPGLALCLGCASGETSSTKSPAVETAEEPEVPVDTGSPEDTAPPDPEPDPLDSLYAIDRMVQVDIELSPDDWEALRFESRNLLELLSGDCRAEPFGSPYNWYEAAVTLDGELYGRVEVRKKGFIGSLSVDRPSPQRGTPSTQPARLYSCNCRPDSLATDTKTRHTRAL